MGVLVFGIMFLAVLTQTVTGFGLALVSMALLSQWLGIQVAAPLVAMIAALLEITLLIRHRAALNWRAVWRLSLASVLGIPLGLLAVKMINEQVVLTVLGVVIVSYAVYALVSPRLPRLAWSGWAYGVGFIAGILSGAYNTAGPPVVMYGNSQRWSPAEFKSNLQGFFLLNDVFVIGGHALSGHLTPAVWGHWASALPSLALGLLVGLSVERFINPLVFRKIVLLLLVVVGIRLILH